MRITKINEQLYNLRLGTDVLKIIYEGLMLQCPEYLTVSLANRQQLLHNYKL